MVLLILRVIWLAVSLKLLPLLGALVAATVIVVAVGAVDIVNVN